MVKSHWETSPKWGFLALSGGLNSPGHKWENWTCHASDAQHKQVSPISFDTQCFKLILSMFQQSNIFHLVVYFRHTEDSHVKTNIVHTLFRVQKYGLMSIDQFTDILSPADLKRCKKSQKKTWYSLPLPMFTNFTFQVIFYFDFIE